MSKSKSAKRTSTNPAPCHPIIRPEDMLVDNLSRAHAFAVFLWDDACEDHGSPLDGEVYGREIAHELLADSLAWLIKQAQAEGRTA